MHGMFKANGGCGYVKKPDFLLKTGPDNEVFDPKVRLPVKQTLKVSPLIPVLLTVFSLLEPPREVPSMIWTYSSWLSLEGGL